MYSFLRTCCFASLPVFLNYYILHYAVVNDVFNSAFKRLYSKLNSIARDFRINKEPLMMAVVNSSQILQVWRM